MIRRWILLGLSLCVLLCCAVLPVSAAIEKTVLVPEKTKILDGDATVSYTEQGAMVLTSAVDGESAAIVTLDQFINIKTVRYLQMAVNADAPFNIALNMIGKEAAAHPQLSGPAWREAFGLHSELEDIYIPAGHYTISLDILNYLEYNGVTIDDDGYVTIESVMVLINGKGTVTVDRLSLANEATFTLANGQTATAAPTLKPQKEPAPAEISRVSEAIDEGSFTVIESEDVAVGLVIVLIVAGAAVLVTVMITLSKKKVRTDDEEEEIYFGVQTRVTDRGLVKKTSEAMMARIDQEEVAASPKTSLETAPEPAAEEPPAKEAQRVKEEQPSAEQAPQQTAKPKKPSQSSGANKYPQSKKSGKKKSNKKKSGKKKK